MSLKVIDNTVKVKTFMAGLTKYWLGVGIPGEFAERKEERGPINNAVLGYLHENGVPGHIPPRPWLIPGFATARADVIKIIENIVQKSGPEGLHNALDMAGLKAVSVIKAGILAGLSPDLAPSTRAARERHSVNANKVSAEHIEAVGYKPLIRTGQLLKSIGHVIRPAGGE